VGFACLWVGLLVAAGIRSPSDAAITSVMAALGTVFIIRIWSIRLVADESGLLVRNFFRTWRFRWDEVEDFRLGRPIMGMPVGWVIHALLRNGEVVTPDITTYSGFPFSGKARQEQKLKRLREWLPRQD